MNRRIAALVLVLMASAAAFAQGPEVRLVDDKLSVDAEAVSLGSLLRLVDGATGMQSSIPPEWEGRNVSVKFSGLDVSAGLQMIFQGLPLNYVVIEGKRVVATAINTPAVPTIEKPSTEDARSEPVQDQQPRGQVDLESPV
jgi:hypothetical protein